MKNVISAETAFALRDAGFIQPKKEIGQFWYLLDSTVPNNDDLVFITKSRHMGNPNTMYVYVNEHSRFYGEKDAEHRNWAYAPTVDEIMEQLGPNYVMIRGANNNRTAIYNLSAFRTFSYPMSTHPIAGEAAAQVFLEKSLKSNDDWIERFTGIKRAFEGVNWGMGSPNMDMSEERVKVRIALLDTGEYVKYDISSHSADGREGEPFALIGAGWLHSVDGEIIKADKPYTYFFRRMAMTPSEIV